MRFFGVVHADGGMVTVIEDTVCGERIISRVIRDNLSEVTAKRFVAKLTRLENESGPKGFKVSLPDTARCQNCGLYKTASVEATSCVTYEDDANPFGLLPVVGEHNFQSEN